MAEKRQPTFSSDVLTVENKQETRFKWIPFEPKTLVYSPNITKTEKRPVKRRDMSELQKQYARDQERMRRNRPGAKARRNKNENIRRYKRAIELAKSELDTARDKNCEKNIEKWTYKLKIANYRLAELNPYDNLVVSDLTVKETGNLAKSRKQIMFVHNDLSYDCAKSSLGAGDELTEAFVTPQSQNLQEANGKESGNRQSGSRGRGKKADSDDEWQEDSDYEWQEDSDDEWQEDSDDDYKVNNRRRKKFSTSSTTIFENPRENEQIPFKDNSKNARELSSRSGTTGLEDDPLIKEALEIINFADTKGDSGGLTTEEMVMRNKAILILRGKKYEIERRIDEIKLREQQTSYGLQNDPVDTEFFIEAGHEVTSNVADPSGLIPDEHFDANNFVPQYCLGEHFASDIDLIPTDIGDNTYKYKLADISKPQYLNSLMLAQRFDLKLYNQEEEWGYQ